MLRVAGRSNHLHLLAGCYRSSVCGARHRWRLMYLLRSLNIRRAITRSSSTIVHMQVDSVGSRVAAASIGPRGQLPLRFLRWPPGVIEGSVAGTAQLGANNDCISRTSIHSLVARQARDPKRAVYRGLLREYGRPGGRGARQKGEDHSGCCLPRWCDRRSGSSNIPLEWRGWICAEPDEYRIRPPRSWRRQSAQGEGCRPNRAAREGHLPGMRRSKQDLRKGSDPTVVAIREPGSIKVSEHRAAGVDHAGRFAPGPPSLSCVSS